MRLNSEVVEQLAGIPDTEAGSPAAAAVVAGRGVGWGCSAPPRPASGSYLRCLLCRVGVDCTVPGASLERTAAGAADTAGPLEGPQVCWDLAGGRGRGLGCLRPARPRLAAVAGNLAADGTAATVCSDAARLAVGIRGAGPPCCLWLTGVSQLYSCSPALRGLRLCARL